MSIRLGRKRHVGSWYRTTPVLIALLVVAAAIVGPVAATDQSLDVSDTSTMSHSKTSLPTYTLAGCPSDPIEQPGVYELTRNITNSTEGDCIDVNVSNVVIDGNGYLLEGIGSGNGRPIHVWNRPKGDGTDVLSGVTVENLTVTGWEKAVTFQKVSRATVTDNVIVDGGDGVRLFRATDSSVVDNTVRNRTDAILLDGARDTLVARNTLQNNRWRGVVVHSASHPEEWSTNNRIENNTIVGNGINGVKLTESSNYTEVVGNTITDNGQDAGTYTKPGGVYAGDSSHVRIVDNVITDNAGNGIGIEDAAGWTFGVEDVTIADNRIRRNGNYGVRLKDSGNDVMVNNTVGSNHLDGVVVWSSPNATIRDNDVFNHTDEPGTVAGRGVRVMNDYDGVQVVDNDVYDNRIGVNVEGGSGLLAVRGNRIESNRDFGVRVNAFASKQIEIHHNVIAGNGKFGVENHEYNHVIDATYNWWGDASGPNSSARASQTLSDPVTGAPADGTGDAISEKYKTSGIGGTPTGDANVHFDPWRTTTVTSCPDVTTSGHHTLTQNVTNSPERYCVNVTADDVTLDGMGHVIDGIGGDNVSAGPSPPVGIHVTGENVTITNVTVTDWMTGIVYRNATGFVTHSNVTNADLDGIVVRDATAELRWNEITADDDGVQTTNSTVVVTDTAITNDDDTDLQRGVRANGNSTVNLMDTTIENAAITGILVNTFSEGRIRTTTINDSEVGVEVSSLSTGFIAGSEINGSDTAGVRVEWNSSFDVTLNNVTNVGGSAVVLGPRAKANRVQIHGNNFVGVTQFGVLNRNQSAVVNATGNYWGDASGPSSNSSDPDAPFADPSSGASADGSGAAVSEGLTTGVSNVHFDPHATSEQSPGSPGSSTTSGSPTTGPTTKKAIGGTTETGTKSGSSGNSPGFTPLTAVVALLAFALVARRRIR